MKRIVSLFPIILLWISVLVSNQPQLVTANSTITVNTTSDAIVNDSNCSLREAIIAANTNSAFNGCLAGSGTDTIEFSPSLSQPFTISLTTIGKNEDSSMSGDLDITDDLIIIGVGSSNSTIDGNNTDRVLEVHNGSQLTLSGFTIKNGNPGAGVDGGGILVNGILTLSESAVQENQGNGISNDGGIVSLTNVNLTNNSGYGVRNHNLGSLTFEGGEVRGNSGGGVYNAASSAELTNLLISENLNGSGVYNLGNTSLTQMTIDLTDIWMNTSSANGGGVYNSGNSATTTISNSRIQNNTASAGNGAGGGVFNNGIMGISASTIDNNQARTGGGIEHSGSNLNLKNVTISSNEAEDDGGGLYNRGSAVLNNVTMNANLGSTGANIFNDESSIAIGNSIVANSDLNGNCFNSNGFINSQGHNMDSGTTCGFDQTGDQTNVNPLLGLLADNGGQTVTHALNAASPAIEGGNNTTCEATDQRGVARPQGVTCDIGAFEADATADLSLDILANSPLISVSDTMTYTISVKNQGILLAQSIVLTDTLPLAVTYVDSFDDSGGACQHISGTVRCTLPSLAANVEWLVTIVADTPATEQQLSNFAEVSTTTRETILSNNTAVFLSNVAIIKSLYLPIILKNN